MLRNFGLTYALGRYHRLQTAQESRIEAQRRTAEASQTRAAYEWFIEEDKKVNALAVDAYHDLLRTLSPAGAVKLREHLDYIKTKMKIYPPPDMSGQVH